MKARGDGLGYDLIKAEFHFEEGVSSNTATVWIDGVQQPRSGLFCMQETTLSGLCKAQPTSSAHRSGRQMYSMQATWAAIGGKVPLCRVHDLRDSFAVGSHVHLSRKPWLIYVL